MSKRKKQFDIITVGGATRDIMFYSDEGELIATGNLTKQKLLAFEYGTKIVADKLFFTYGGGSANTASTFASLGLEVASVCRVGDDDNGRYIVNNLKNKGICTDYVSVGRREESGFSMILTVNNPAKEHIVFGYRGANDNLTDYHLPLSVIDTPWIYVSSLPKTGWQNIMKKATGSGSNVVWNPGGRQLQTIGNVKAFLPKIKILIINRDEALEFRKVKDIRGLLKYIKKLGPEMVVITDGSNGSFAYDGDKYYYMRARPTKNADTVGVGDAFASAFVSGMILGKTIRECLNWGMKNSSSVISQIGAQNGILTRRKISK